MKYFTETNLILTNLFMHFRRRDFSGNTGQVIKNSSYQFSTQLLAKIGSFIFTVIVARLLMTELFGLYSLALSTILIFTAFSEIGIGATLIRFISKELEKKNGKIKSYLFYFGKIKIFLIVFLSILLLFLSNFLANTFYQKPIFLALLAGAMYVVFTQITGFFQSMLQAKNNFKSVTKKEIVFQISRIILIPLAIIFSIKYSLSDEISLMFIILLLAFSFFIASIFLFIDSRRAYFKIIKKKDKRSLAKKEKKTLNKFLFATAILAVSGTFFGNIDRVMLGKFVEAEFIGYYTAAFSFIGALTPLIGFAAIALLPIFSRLKGKRLEEGFKKSLRIIILVSIIGFFATILLAHLGVLIIFGREYLLAENILRLFAILLFFIPAISIYTSYYISQGKPNKVAKLLIFSTILNVILNYVLITYFLNYGQLAAVYGAAIATVISQGVYLLGLVIGQNIFTKNKS